MYEDGMPVEQESEENLEVAEPDEQESEENLEVAEPENSEVEETDADRAFADMRRSNRDKDSRIAELEAQLAEAKRNASHSQDVFRQMGYEGDNPTIVAEAEKLGVDPNDLAAYYAEQQERDNDKAKLEEQEEQINRLQAEKIAMQIVDKLSKSYPEIKGVEDIPEKFWEYIDLSGERNTPDEVMYMVKAWENKDKRTPPKEIGKINEPDNSKEYFTEAEVDAMTPETKIKNHEKIMKSMRFW